MAAPLATDQDGNVVTRAELPKIVSVDDHVVEPAHLFATWLPVKYRDRGPVHVRTGCAGITFISPGARDYVVDESGTPADWWFYEDLRWPQQRTYAASGYSREQMTLEPMTYDEMRRGCYEPAARLADMDLNWVEASLCFPTFPRFCGQRFLDAKDRDVALACVRAYNDWMVEEWCGDSGGRLIPLCLIPLWDAELAAAEVRRNARRGVRAVAFSEMPYRLGLPALHTGLWDPFLAACHETDTVINMHVGSSSAVPLAAPGGPPAASVVLTFNFSMTSLTDWLYSGKLEQFPNLKLAYSEGQIGWLPYLLERADDVWTQHRAWGEVNLAKPPSESFREHVFGCFFRDRHGLESLDTIGVDNVTFETDYPHIDSTWPDTKEIALEMTAGLSDEAIYKVMRKNAIRMLSLDLD